MPQRMRAFVLLCAAAGIALLATTDASAITSKQCLARVNDTPSKLVECVQTNDLWNHMKAFQAIADANLGPDGHPSRNSGEPGYKASVDYVAAQMAGAGYDVTLQPYTIQYFAFIGTPSFKQVSPTPHDYVFNADWGPGASTGTTTAAIQPVAGIVLPPPRRRARR